MVAAAKAGIGQRSKGTVPSSSVKYARVKQSLKDGLAAGRWPPGALMPSDAELVASFGVSRMTVTRAIRELQAEGLVARSQGVGTFAAAAPQRLASTLTIRDLHDEITASGRQHTAVVHLARQERAPALLAERLGLQPQSAVFHSLVVHFCNGVPLQCEDRYVNPACAPGYLQVDFTQTTPTHYLLQVAPAWEAQYSIEASAPTAQEARLLGIAASDPCLVMVRSTRSRGSGRSQGMPVTIARLVHPGQRYSLTGSIAP